MCRGVEESGCGITQNKIENGNGEYVIETTTWPKSRQQPKTTNGSSMQRETPAPGCMLQLALNKMYASSVIMD